MCRFYNLHLSTPINCCASYRLNLNDRNGKVSLTSRRCLYDVCRTKAKGSEALSAYMNTDRDNI